MPHSHTLPRTNRKPCRRSAATEWWPLARESRDDIASTIAADSANDAESTAKAVPTPSPATSQPPSAGPASRKQIGRMNWSSEFAWASSDSGSRSGTMASNAGPKNAVPAP